VIAAAILAGAIAARAPHQIPDERLIHIARRYAQSHKIDLRDRKPMVVYRGADFETVDFRDAECLEGGCLGGSSLFIIKTATGKVVQYRVVE
jgi:hypothetical protein